jgi:predicted nucleic acid-binding protein
LPLILVVDASVAARWVLPEPGSERALALRDEQSDLIAPDLIVAEVANTVWKYARRGAVSSADAAAAVDVAVAPLSRLAPVHELLGTAMAMALRHGHPVYDCFYLALAHREGATIATVDQAQFEMARRARISARLL